MSEVYSKFDLFYFAVLFYRPLLGSVFIFQD